MAISKVIVDEEELRTRLVDILSRSGAWQDLMPTNVGSTILDMVAGATVINQHAIHTSLREAFLTRAFRASSIYENVVSKGIPLARKSSSSTTARLSSNYTTTRILPVMSQFNVGGNLFYSREQLTLAPGSTVTDVHLYQGEVFDVEFDIDSLSSTQLATFKLGFPNFVVSESDLTVWTESKDTGEVTLWEKTEESLFDLTSDDKVYYELTSGDGDVAFVFGDGTYGSQLPSNHRLHVQGITTKGVEVSGVSGITVQSKDYPLISGSTTVTMVQGADIKGAEYYKQFGPIMFRARKKAISATEVRGIIMKQSDVADCQIQTQRDIAPNDPKWQNVMRVCILPRTSDTWGGSNPNPRSSQWELFVESLDSKLQALAQFQRWNPTKVYVRVSVNVYIKRGYVVSEIKSLVTEQVLALFKRRAGILGRKLTIHDLDSACSVEGVDYVNVLSPTSEITPNDSTYYVVLDGAPTINVVYSNRTQIVG